MLDRNGVFSFRVFSAKEKGMSMTQAGRSQDIETAITEALGRIERQRQMIADFQARGYDVRAPLTLLACLLLNLRRLEDKRRAEKLQQPVQRTGGTIAHPTSSGALLCK